MFFLYSHIAAKSILYGYSGKTFLSLKDIQALFFF